MCIYDIIAESDACSRQRCVIGLPIEFSYRMARV